MTVTLVQSTGGSRIDAAGSIAHITLPASDEPHGIFAFASATASVSEPSAGTATVTVRIVRTGGAIGEVTVLARTRTAAEVGSGPSRAVPDSDFDAILETAVVFRNGETAKDLALVVRADTLPEIDEVLTVLLTAVSVRDGDKVGPYQGSSPRLGTMAACNVTILENDNARGIIQFMESRTRISVNESNTVRPFLLERTEGLFHSVSVDWFTLSITGAIETLDYTSPRGTLVFPEGVSQLSLPMFIFDDAEPEMDEEFQIVLGSAGNGVVIGPRSKLDVVIVENDDARGVLAFASGSLTRVVDEPASGRTTLRFDLVRSGGLFGSVIVHWSLEDGAFTDDILATSGFVSFAPFLNTGRFDVVVLSDDIAEMEERMTFRLTRVEGGGRVATSNMVASVLVRANDDPYGIFSFASLPASAVATEATRFANVTIFRTGGLLQPVAVTVAVLPLPPSALLSDPIVAFADQLPAPLIYSLFSAPQAGRGATTDMGLFSAGPSPRYCSPAGQDHGGRGGEGERE